ncbi:MAG: DMT family transporter [Stappiaceae bacterium]
MAMLVFIVFVSTSFPLGEAIAPTLDPKVLTLLRFVVAAALIGLATIATGSWQRPSWRHVGSYFLLGFMLSTFFVTMFSALQKTTAANTGAIFALIPAMTSVIAFFLLRQRPSGIQILCLLIGCAGTIIVLFGNDFAALSGLSLGPGEQIYLIGCAAYAFYAPVFRLCCRDVSPMMSNFGVLSASALMLAAYIAWEQPDIAWQAIPISTHLGILYLAVFSTAISVLMINYASARLPAGKVMSYTYLLPALVVVENMMIGKGWPGIWILAGVAITALATLVLQMGTTSERTNPSAAIAKG